MDKCWVTGIGQDADWWLGYWDENRTDDDGENARAELPHDDSSFQMPF